MDKHYFKLVLKRALSINQWSYIKRPSSISFFGLFSGGFWFSRFRSASVKELLFESVTGFKGEYYFATARMGLYWFLKQRDIGSGDKVILQAFNCAVVPDAVLKTGAKPLFVDIELNSLNPSFDNLRDAMKDPTVKAIVLQNSFGFSQNFRLSELKKKRPDILFILDSALSFTTNAKVWVEYREFDCVLLSFDLSKPIAIISGGAILVPHGFKSDAESYAKVPDLCKNAERALLTKLRILWLFGKRDGLARLFLYLLSGCKRRYFSSAFDGFQEGSMHPGISSTQYSYPSKMPRRFIALLRYKLRFWNEEEAVKKSFAAFVLKTLKRMDYVHLLPSNYVQDIHRWVPLRIPLAVTNKKIFRENWGEFYNSEQWWFSSPVISCYAMNHFGYKKRDCVNAEKLGDEIVNFPVPSKSKDLKVYQRGFENFLVRIKNANEQ